MTARLKTPEELEHSKGVNILNKGELTPPPPPEQREEDDDEMDYEEDDDDVVYGEIGGAGDDEEYNAEDFIGVADDYYDGYSDPLDAFDGDEELYNDWRL